VAQKCKYNQPNKTAQGIPNPLGKRLYTVKEAAAYLGRGTYGMRDLIWKGLIPTVIVDGGRKIYVDIYDLDHFIEKNKTTYH
jgi:hypothetical protein